MRFPIFIILALLVACGEEHTEVLTIGPTPSVVSVHLSKDCFMEYNEEAGAGTSSTTAFKASFSNRDTSIRLR